jgi:hypothetical protein
MQIECRERLFLLLEQTFLDLAAWLAPPLLKARSSTQVGEGKQSK